MPVQPRDEEPGPSADDADDAATAAGAGAAAASAEEEGAGPSSSAPAKDGKGYSGEHAGRAAEQRLRYACQRDATGQANRPRCGAVTCASAGSEAPAHAPAEYSEALRPLARHDLSYVPRLLEPAGWTVQ